mmetsp:Transcript_22060/g.62665  ORF Transcript_22060/g.62665 Transcript_22060/m.62665 type:complete len:214 (+) Transcript_22060:937-1578(+)
MSKEKSTLYSMNLLERSSRCTEAGSPGGASGAARKCGGDGAALQGLVAQPLEEAALEVLHTPAAAAVVHHREREETKHRPTTAEGGGQQVRPSQKLVDDRHPVRKLAFSPVEGGVGARRRGACASPPVPRHCSDEPQRQCGHGTPRLQILKVGRNPRQQLADGVLQGGQELPLRMPLHDELGHHEVPQRLPGTILAVGGVQALRAAPGVGVAV